MSRTSSLLLNEHPLQVLPSLAVAVGLEPAIILQQLHYWLTKPGVQVVDDLPWVYNTYQKWHQQFPFMTVKVIGNAFRKLEAFGVVKADHHNDQAYNRTKWYTIDYDALENLGTSLDEPSIVPNGTLDDADSGHSSLPETTTETTSETTVKTATPSFVKITMDTLESLRGYPSTNYGQDVKGVKGMEKLGYTTAEIMACYESKKKDPWWKEKPLTMMSVKSAIGEWKKHQTGPAEPEGAKYTRDAERLANRPVARGS